MLTELHIKNLAIIDRLHLEFGAGFTVLTGETGAGKSILIDALNLLLGSRASGEMVRSGEEEALVEGLFQIGREELKGVDRQGGTEELLIRRLVHSSGKSRAYLNGSPLTLSMLEGRTAGFVDIYGQHEHHGFLDPRLQLAVLDGFGGLGGPLRAYQKLFSALAQDAAGLAGLLDRHQRRSDRLELLDYQSQEISRARLVSGEEEALNSERDRLLHAARLQAIAHQGWESLYGERGSAAELLQTTLRHLREGAKIDPALGSLAPMLESALFQAQDVATALRLYGERAQADPGRLEVVESRRNEIQRLKKKYGRPVEAILKLKEEIDRERSELESLEGKVQEGQKAWEELKKQALSGAGELSKKRQEIARSLGRQIEEELFSLGMPQARFAIRLEPELEAGSDEPRLGERGMDRVQFLISPNPGEELKPLSRIASGGELSRIMLALKRILAKESFSRTLVFDEVDAGIGGGIAEVVGRKLKEISRLHQVFCVTHLAQIACLADAHYGVSKKVQDKRTWVEVKRLRGREREEEIARMLGGMQITVKTLEHAREMLKNSSEFGVLK